MRSQSLPVLLVVVAGQGQLGGVVAEDMQMISPEVARGGVVVPARRGADVVGLRVRPFAWPNHAAARFSPRFARCALPRAVRHA